MKKNKISIYVVNFVLVCLLVGCATYIPHVNFTQTPIASEKLITIEVTRQVIQEKLKLVTVVATRLVEVTATPQPTKTLEPEEIIATSTRLSGNYAFSGGNDGRGCHLKVDNTQSRIPPESVSYYPEKFVSRIYFDLECSTGAPSYNMGFASGVILESGNAAVYRYISEIFDEECNLIFIFSENIVNVYQIGEWYACGFGGNVYADGTYIRVDN